MKRVPAIFFRTSNGREPVREWLKSLSSADRRRIGQDIKTVEFGWPVGMPLCRHLGHQLWEVRTTLTKDGISRVIFCIYQGQLVLLHGFIKKSQRIPKQELDLALQRKRLLEEADEEI